jgi:alpha-tubulin suppressor-like RCC1 family protein
MEMQAPDGGPIAEACVPGLFRSGDGCLKAVDTSVGYSHSCAVLSDGSVQCWGEDLISPSAELISKPVVVQGLPPIDAISVGATFVCAKAADGRGYCWGHGTNGELGSGTQGDSAVPVPIVGFGDALKIVKLVAGHSSACAITNAGTLMCWGYNEQGFLGDGTFTNRFVPTQIPGLSNVVDIAANGAETCVVLQNGTAKCWGYNMFAQLGDGTRDDSIVPVEVSDATNARQIATSGVHGCLLSNSGSVWCWGYNGLGALGVGNNFDRMTATRVVALPEIESVSAGSEHTCALSKSGSVFCWGNNRFGQLGVNVDGSSNVPVQVALPELVKVLKAGAMSTCAVGTSGQVRCWGRTKLLGANQLEQRSVPAVLFALGEGNKQIAAGGEFTCVLTAAGGVKCWGQNDVGQLGLGNATPVATPHDVLGLSVDVKQLALGEQYACALTQNARVLCWGECSRGQFECGQGSIRRTPVEISGMQGAVDVWASGHQMCGLFDQGNVKCMGGTYGATPTVVAGATFSALAVGTEHACGIMPNSDGVGCWGTNLNSQLGINLPAGSALPVKVPLTNPVIQLSANQSSTCAVDSTGGVLCWGANAAGQLGGGDPIFTAPYEVPGLGGDVKKLRVGSGHSCARKGNGTTYCWGSNGSGQLGLDSRATQSLPTRVVALGTDADDFAMGASHTCALTTAGAVKCWGSGTFGQLGDGLTGFSPTPTLVVNQ